MLSLWVLSLWVLSVREGGSPPLQLQPWCCPQVFSLLSQLCSRWRHPCMGILLSGKAHAAEGLLCSIPDVCVCASLMERSSFLVFPTGLD